MNKEANTLQIIIDALKKPYGMRRLTYIYRWLVWDGRWEVYERLPRAKKSRFICSVEEEYLDVALQDLMSEDDD